MINNKAPAFLQVLQPKNLTNIEQGKDSNNY